MRPSLDGRIRHISKKQCAGIYKIAPALSQMVHLHVSSDGQWLLSQRIREKLLKAGFAVPIVEGARRKTDVRLPSIAEVHYANDVDSNAAEEITKLLNAEGISPVKKVRVGVGGPVPIEIWLPDAQ